MSRPRRILLAAILVISFVFAFHSLVFRPKMSEILRLRGRQETLRETLETARGYVEKYKTVKAAFDSISATWEVLEELLPEQEEMPELLRNMAESGRSSGAEYLLFKPLTPVPQDFYNENPIQIRVTCGYHELGIFLSKIAHLNRLVNVRGLKLTSTGEGVKTLEAEFVATAYVTTGERAPSPMEKK